MDEYITIRRRAEATIEVNKSVFIGNICPVKTDEEAVAFINEMKQRYSDARHNVYAYSLRNNSILRYSDDHEPQGTAGMPVLDAMRKRGITDAVIVVTRYFGGVLLGTGGLVRAYTECAKQAIEASEPCKMQLCAAYSLLCSYSDYQKIIQQLSSQDVSIQDTRFSDAVTVDFSIPKDVEQRCLLELSDACAGKCKLEKKGEKYIFTKIL